MSKLLFTASILGTDLNNVSISRSEELQIPFCKKKLTVVVNKGKESFHQYSILDRLTTVESNAFGIFPYSDKAVPKISLKFFLGKVQT